LTKSEKKTIITIIKKGISFCPIPEFSEFSLKNKVAQRRLRLKANTARNLCTILTAFVSFENCVIPVPEAAVDVAVPALAEAPAILAPTATTAAVPTTDPDNKKINMGYYCGCTQ